MRTDKNPKLYQIGVLHPGEMGISIAAAAQRGGHTLHWVSHGRSPETHSRAAQFQLQEHDTVADLCAQCDMVISICPPAAAEEVAAAVVATRFAGIYVDANAISPQRARLIGERVSAAGMSFVDGGVIGGPAWERGGTTLHLAGASAPIVADCFGDSPLLTQLMGGEVGAASALKMCYAAYTKGTTALLCAILATAEDLGVREALVAQWDQDDPTFAPQTEQRARRVTRKAWRYVGEMDEISATFAAAGLPGDFHDGAAAVYSRLSAFKGAAELPTLAEVLLALREGEEMA